MLDFSLSYPRALVLIVLMVLALVLMILMVLALVLMILMLNKRLDISVVVRMVITGLILCLCSAIVC